MGKIAGVDLGTTYSCIAIINDVDEPEVIPNIESSNVTPSVVFFETETNVVVGETAKGNSLLEPAKSVSFVKRLMGKSNFAINVYNTDYSPEQISSLILTKLVTDAEHYINDKIEKVVITCPAYFGTAEKEATKAAGEMAGLNVIDIINEPTAAAICYGLLKGESNKTVLVYDLGGGTFDVTIIRIEEDKNGKKVIRTVSTAGDFELGGKDWDSEIMRYLQNAFAEETHVSFPLEEEEQLIFEQDLIIKAEKCKQQLTTMTKTRVPLIGGGKRANIEISREKFEELTSFLLERTIEEMEKAISSAKEKGVDHIDEIILVGGSTKMPQVEAILEKKYPELPRRLYDPNEAVAKGAALYAQSLEPIYIRGTDKTGPTDEPPIKIINVTSKSFGLDLVHEDGTPYVKNIIFKDSEVPIEKTIGCSTFSDNQISVEIVVYETPIPDATFDPIPDYVLGKAVLEFDAPRPKNTDLTVTFSLEANGILHVRGVETATGKDVDADFQSSSILTREEIEEQKEAMKKIKYNAE